MITTPVWQPLRLLATLGFLLARMVQVTAQGQQSFLPGSITLELPVQPVTLGSNWSVGFIDDPPRPVQQAFRSLQIYVLPSPYPQSEYNVSARGMDTLGNITIDRPAYVVNQDTGNYTRGFQIDTLDSNQRVCIPKNASGTDMATRHSWEFNTAQFPEARSFSVQIAQMFFTNLESGVEEVREGDSDYLCISPPIRNFSIATATFLNTTASGTVPGDSSATSIQTTFSFPTSQNAYGERQPAEVLQVPGAATASRPLSVIYATLVCFAVALLAGAHGL